MDENSERALAARLIGALEVLSGTLAKDLSQGRVHFILDAGKRIKVLDSAADMRKVFGSLGGEELFFHIAKQINSYFERKHKPFYEGKISELKPVQVGSLLEKAHGLLEDVIDEEVKAMRKKRPEVKTISLGMVRDFIETGDFHLPSYTRQRPDMGKFGPEFDLMEAQLDYAHKKLGPFAAQVPLFSLKFIADEGLDGLREKIKKTPFLFQRLNLASLGVRSQKKRLFAPLFEERIEANPELVQEAAVMEYIQRVNDIVLQLRSNPALEDALDTYLGAKASSRL